MFDRIAKGIAARQAGARRARAPVTLELFAPQLPHFDRARPAISRSPAQLGDRASSRSTRQVGPECRRRLRSADSRVPSRRIPIRSQRRRLHRDRSRAPTRVPAAAATRRRRLDRPARQDDRSRVRSRRRDPLGLDRSPAPHPARPIRGRRRPSSTTAKTSNSSSISPTAQTPGACTRFRLQSGELARARVRGSKVRSSGSARTKALPPVGSTGLAHRGRPGTRLQRLDRRDVLGPRHDAQPHQHRTVDRRGHATASCARRSTRSHSSTRARRRAQGRQDRRRRSAACVRTVWAQPIRRCRASSIAIERRRRSSTAKRPRSRKIDRCRFAELAVQPPTSRPGQGGLMIPAAALGLASAHRSSPHSHATSALRMTMATMLPRAAPVMKRSWCRRSFTPMRSKLIESGRSAPRTRPARARSQSSHDYLDVGSNTPRSSIRSDARSRSCAVRTLPRARGSACCRSDPTACEGTDDDIRSW